LSEGAAGGINLPNFLIEIEWLKENFRRGREFFEKFSWQRDRKGGANEVRSKRAAGGRAGVGVQRGERLE
jgi:hypothetical protein